MLTAAKHRATFNLDNNTLLTSFLDGAIQQIIGWLKNRISGASRHARRLDPAPYTENVEQGLLIAGKFIRGKDWLLAFHALGHLANNQVGKLNRSCSNDITKNEF